MKKILGAVLVLFLCSNVYADYFVPKLCLDFNGNFDTEVFGITVNSDASSGMGLGLELLSGTKEDVMFGAGFEYQVMRKITSIAGVDVSDQDMKFGFLPFYGTLRFNVNTQKNDLTPFFRFNLGYNAFSANSAFKGGSSLTGGLYYALGGGVTFKNNVNLELLYSVCNGKEKAYGITADEKYSKLGVTIGVLIDIDKK
ncbi:MAG: hypothetical protein JW871_05415 [Endomicrobiales bacterium]|nr:hypothetical protein [Endomicrobiales bacterium]